MPAKTPIYLKSNNSKKGKKCRLRDILSPDMISPPLGDFRHTVHIGKGGDCDTFGDMSFLQGKFELLPGKGAMVRPGNVANGEFIRANSTSDASFVETPSPILKNAISLPTIGGGQALTLPLLSTKMFSMARDPLDGLTGPPTPPAGSEDVDEFEILQMENLLQSIAVFRCDPSPGSEEVDKKFPLKPLGTGSFPKISSNDSLNSDGENTDALMTSLFFNANHNENGNSNGSSICRGNGSYNNGCNNTSGDIIYHYDNELAGNKGDWADRDSGVEEGRICDFDFEHSKSKSLSQESVSHNTGSLLSLELDLGPSILDDILGIMGKTVP